MSIFGYHFNRLGLILSAIETLIAGFIFMLAGSFFLAGAGKIELDIFGSVVLPSVVLLLSLMALGSYHKEAWRSVEVMAKRLFASALFGSVAIIIIQYAVLGYRPSALKIAFCASFSCLVALCARLVARRLTGLRQRIKPRALVLGAGPKASTLWRSLGEGFDGPALDGFIALQGNGADALPMGRVVGMPPSLAAYAAQHRIDEIVVAVDENDTRLPERDLILCRMAGIAITDSSSFVERETGRIKLDLLESRWLIFAPGFYRGLLRDVVKRLTDLSASGLLLLLTVPLFPLIALAIKLNSKGPVFYRQRRVGLHGRSFDIVKFRSMCADAEADGRAVWAAAGDCRVTAVGKFLRLSRLDELPQLINVLKGEMSIVGPRPERPQFVEQLSAELPFYMERHTVRPGITGWAQINYPYGASIEEAKAKLEYDLYYVKNHTWFLDIVTMFQTLRIALGGIGAR
jgi:sugar transferase (PEP-CTERM system associated)